ncbi:adenosine deaminase [Micrococcoides hystricis]|uniref:adenosine deaminase n=1 Tax=Micrococcoides hystricis TaxID=1572761 RepID=A0ABV6P9X2_9MICC
MSPTQLQKTLRKALAEMPKISLHDHLDGGLRPHTMIELAEAAGHQLPSTNVEELTAWFSTKANSGSLPEYLECFAHTTAVMQSAEALERIAKEAVEDLAADGVIYAELRWAPEQHLDGGLTLQDTVDAVQAGIEAGMSAAGGRILVTQLLTAMRHADRSQEIAELTIANLGRGLDAEGNTGFGVVGFDIAGAEDGFPPSRFVKAFDHLAQHLVPVTVHAGEAAGVDSIHDALFSGRALRLGHGVRIAEDLNVTDEHVEFGSVAQWVLDRGIPLELCPSSNVQTGALASFGGTAADHPLPLLYGLNFNTTINTDNRLLSVTTLTEELARAAENFEFSFDDLLAMQINAAEAAFVDFDTRAALVDRLILGWQ